MQKITPCLWFDNQAEEAARFYVSVFKDGKVGDITPYGDAGPGPKGSAMTVEFELRGQTYLGLNGGPVFRFTEAISLQIDCADQAETDYFWEALSADGGETSQCGWLKDRYGLSWQVTPRVLTQMIKDKDPEKSRRVMEAMLKMTRIDIAKLKAAYDG